MKNTISLNLRDEVLCRVTITASEETKDAACRDGHNLDGMIFNEYKKLKLSDTPSGSIPYISVRTINHGQRYACNDLLNITVDYPLKHGSFDESFKETLRKDFKKFSKVMKRLEEKASVEEVVWREFLSDLQERVDQLAADSGHADLTTANLLEQFWSGFPDISSEYTYSYSIFVYRSKNSVFRHLLKLNEAFAKIISGMKSTDEFHQKLVDFSKCLNDASLDLESVIPEDVVFAFNSLIPQLVSSLEQELAGEKRGLREFRLDFVKSHGSERLKLGLELGENMNRLFREEYAQHEFNCDIEPYAKADFF